MDRDDLLLNVATCGVDGLLSELSPRVNVVMIPAAESICSEVGVIDRVLCHVAKNRPIYLQAWEMAEVRLYVRGACLDP